MRTKPNNCGIHCTFSAKMTKNATSIPNMDKCRSSIAMNGTPLINRTTRRSLFITYSISSLDVEMIPSSSSFVNFFFMFCLFSSIRRTKRSRNSCSELFIGKTSIISIIDMFYSGIFQCLCTTYAGSTIGNLAI